MKLIYPIGLWLLFQWIPMDLQAQDAQSSFDFLVHRFLEEEEQDISEKIEYLEDLLLEPLNINTCTVEDLAMTGLLTMLQARQIILYREELGPFLDVHELQAVAGIDAELAWILSAFLRSGASGVNKMEMENLFSEFSSEIFLRWNRKLQQAKAYQKDSVYEGSRDAGLLKCKISLGKKVHFAMLAEKDAGESLFAGSNRYTPDHLSAYLHFKQLRSWLPTVVLGDFKVNAGQGLLAFSGYRLGKSAEVLSIVNAEPSINRYASIGEVDFLRGFGLHIQKGPFSFFPVLSYRVLDAQLNYDSTAPDSIKTYISSFPLSGYHRSLTELSNEKKAGRWIYGGILSWQSHRWKWGLNVFLDHFQFDVQESIKIYNQFARRGQNNRNLSLDYSKVGKKISFAGEVALTNKNSLAMVHSMQASLARDLDIGILWRSYPRDFLSVMGKGFAENSSGNNETGLYFSLLLQLNKNWKIQGYIDIWHFKWLRYQVDAPSRGQEVFFKLNYRKKRKLSFYTLLKYERKEKNLSNDEDAMHPLFSQASWRMRIHLAYHVNRQFEFRNRLEWNLAEELGQAGFLIYQDILFKPIAFPLSFTARWALFDSPVYQTRIYAYENDLLYNSLIPAYNKKGNRFYFNLRYKINRSLQVEARIARTFYPEEESISSGHEQIDGNRVTDIKCQLRLKF